VAKRTSKRARRNVIGVIEPVTVRGRSGEVKVLAKIDTGASRTTVDTELAARVGLGPVLDTVRIRAPSSDFPETRALVDADIVIAGREFDVPAAITDRKDMRYHVIIGMDILRDAGFLVDPKRDLDLASRTDEMRPTR
jgi:hypothetical protein